MMPITTIDGKIMELVTSTYMHNKDMEKDFEKNVRLRISLEKGIIDHVSLFINDKLKMKIAVDRTKSDIIELDAHDSNALKYIIPFAKSLGVSKIQVEEFHNEQLLKKAS